MEKWRFLLATDKFRRYFLYFRDLAAPWAIYMGGLSRPVHAHAGRGTISYERCPPVTVFPSPQDSEHARVHHITLKPYVANLSKPRLNP